LKGLRRFALFAGGVSLRPIHEIEIAPNYDVYCYYHGLGTALQAGKSRLRFPNMSLEFFTDIILPAAL
jgi:hypothetical protein